MSARTWPEDSWPTAEQWLDWLLEQSRETQIAAATQALSARRAAASCFERHDDEGAMA